MKSILIIILHHPIRNFIPQDHLEHKYHNNNNNANDAITLSEVKIDFNFDRVNKNHELNTINQIKSSGCNDPNC